jgi:pimeloyl-ACP methyl ester carboxylesterase
VLVSSGGLGRDVSPLLRGAALPGAMAGLRVAASGRVLAGIDRLADGFEARGWRKGVYLRAIARALRPLEHRGARVAFLETLRSVIDRHGQRVSAMDRLYLLEPMPTMVVWGGRDRTIPVEHGRAAHAAIPNGRFELLPKAAHFPHLEDPEGLAAVLADFIATTEPCRLNEDDWAQLLASRTVRKRHLRRVA